MKVVVFAHCRNEAQLLPYFLRHYAAFADFIHIFDDNSTDGSQEIIANHPKGMLHGMHVQGLNEDALLDLAHQEYRRHARNYADIAIWPDIDEFVYHPRIVESLEWHRQQGYDCIRTLGFNMMGSELPPDDGVSQLTDIYRTGVRAPVYSKPIVFNPKANIKWSRGKHRLEHENVRISPWLNENAPDPWRLRLLHYRYLTPDYTERRNARQYARSIDKGSAWSNSPQHTGEHSPQWVAVTMRLARDVVHDDACYLTQGDA